MIDDIFFRKAPRICWETSTLLAMLRSNDNITFFFGHKVSYQVLVCGSNQVSYQVSFIRVGCSFDFFVYIARWAPALHFQ